MTDDFDARLEAARRRGGLDRGSAKVEPLAGSALGIGLRMGAELVAALLVGVAIGWALDRWLHTAPILLAVFVLLGGGAGVANVWRVMGPKRPGIER